MSVNDAAIAAIQERQRTRTKEIIEAASIGVAGDVASNALAASILTVIVDSWRAEANYWSESGKRGGTGTARSFRDAATRLAAEVVKLNQAAGSAAPAVLEPEPAQQPEASPMMDYLAGRTDELPVGSVVTVGGIGFTKIESDPFNAPAADQPVLLDDAGPKEEEGTMTINPFVAPAAAYLTSDVKRLTWPEFAGAVRALPIKPQVSYSTMHEIADCGVKYALGRLSRHSDIVPSEVPAWFNIGGTALHKAIATCETDPCDPTGLSHVWLDAFNAEIAAQATATPQYPISTWRSANKGSENYDWWRVEGEAMLRRWVEYHTPELHERTSILRMAQLGGDYVPAIELHFDLDVNGILVPGDIDHVWRDHATGALAIVDVKSGRSRPDSTLQLGLYAWALRKMFAPHLDAAPIAGAYWLARAGKYERFDDLTALHPWEEIEYHAQATATVQGLGAYVPRVSSYCGGCAHRRSCPAQTS